MKNQFLKNPKSNFAFSISKFSLVIICVISTFSLQLKAQMGGKNPEKRAEMYTKKMAEALSLNEDQVSKAKVINLETITQIQTLRKNGQDQSREERMAIMKIKTASDEKIKSLLTEEQKPKFERFLQEEKEMMKKQRNR
ncbi:MAG: hypothetical protein ACRCVT_03650 [Leadbetterella sp.]